MSGAAMMLEPATTAFKLLKASHYQMRLKTYHVTITIAQPLTREVESHEAARTSRVHIHTGAKEIIEPADAICNHVDGYASGRVSWHLVQVSRQDLLVVIGHTPGVYTCLGTVGSFHGYAGCHENEPQYEQ